VRDRRRDGAHEGQSDPPASRAHEGEPAPPGGVLNYAEALAFLDEHVDLERLMGTGRPEAPTTDRIERLVSALGDPQRVAPVIHITGTNGKGSTAQLVTRLLGAHGLTVGTYTSPHLERVNERLARNGEPISDDEFAEQIAAVADVSVLAGVQPSWFEIVTAAAFRWFADIAVDVLVLEVGLLGRWDATNVADAQVAVVTNVGLDHAEYAGPTRAHIAAEKAGIVKAGSTLVLGETDPELVAYFRGQDPAITWQRDIDFDVIENQLALGGRLLDLRTPYATYPEVFLSLNGRHQGDNAVVAVTAVESFFESSLDADVLREAFADVSVPGRFEVLGHQPLVIVDGAHNPAGADVVASVMADDFSPVGNEILVVGFLRGRDPAEMLSALRADDASIVVSCTAPSPRGIPAGEVAQAAIAMGCDDVLTVDDVAQACDAALRRATADDAILVTGSLYVVGAARPHLRLVLP
jgi:dihydrofolate synthase/folylpolyglutamate synthase